MKKLALYILLILPMFSYAQDSINWVSIQEVQNLVKKEPKKVLLYFHTDWCNYCQYMKANTLIHKEVIKYINENFYAVKFNAEYENAVIFNGFRYINKFPGQEKKYHQLALRYAVIDKTIGFPTFVFLGAQFNKLHPPVRGNKSVAKLEMYLKFISENTYQKSTIKEYESRFVSDWDKTVVNKQIVEDEECEDEAL